MTDRRAFLAACSTLGLGSTLLPGVLYAEVTRGAELTVETIKAAEAVAAISLTDAERAMLLDGLKRQVQQVEQVHALDIPNDVPPAVVFQPLMPSFRTRPREDVAPANTRRTPLRVSLPETTSTELAFASVRQLGALLRAKRVTSEQLTRNALQRFEAHNGKLQCVVSLTADRALAQARAADEALARGDDRGALHGIPWGAKDLLAVRGYRTTWGSGSHKEQVIDADASVVQKLDAAGAVLVAKLTLGELAQGDVWFGGRTNNPWRLEEGSSGSSAGSASATAAGLVPFAVGSETLGSISSPSTRCGSTGLRPTFGRVARSGAMALSWTMDKLGPLARSVDCCALAFAAMHGADGQDPTAIDAPFTWEPERGLEGIRIGYVESAFAMPERDPNNSVRVLRATKTFDDAALNVMKALGATLVPVTLPEFPYDALRFILTAEAAAAFDTLTRENRDDLLVQQGAGAWPNTFRTARFISAVDYINANRARTQAMRLWNTLFADVDVIITPTQAMGLSQLMATNLTGHPAVILPHGFRENGTPVSITFLGALLDEARLLRVAHAYQSATRFHLERPPLFV